MIKKIKILSVLLVCLFLSKPAFACDIKKIIDKNFAALKTKYKVNSELYSNKLYQTFIRAESLNCSKLPAENAELKFVNGKLAQIIFEQENADKLLLDFAINNFGKFNNPTNEKKDMKTNYADFSDNKKIIVTYRNSYVADNLLKETLIITSKSLAAELNEFSKEDE